MGFIKGFIDKYQTKIKERNDLCDSYIAQVDFALQDIKDTFNSDDFIDPTQFDKWKNKHSQILHDIIYMDTTPIFKASNFNLFLTKIKELKGAQGPFKNQILMHNNRIAEIKVNDAYNLIGNVEGRHLDRQQMLCIVKKAHNHLVIAGAGTGKTTTVVGKIKHLLKSKQYKSEDILVLSFTNASATEMSQRINAETGCDIAASTFHKLGLNIIKKSSGIAPKITQIELRKFIKEQLSVLMKSNEYLFLLGLYLLYNRVVARSEFEFKTRTEYNEYLRLNPPTTINNEEVKSYGEMDIANFLTQNGVKYIYEYPYEVDTRTEEKGQYCPDFFLPEYNIYIEYFGVNRNGEVPAYFKGSNGMTATQTYQESIKWKRNTHKANNTIMIECYAYEKFEGTLLENLEKKLQENNVELTPKTAQELWSQLMTESKSKSVLDGVIELFETVINLIKSNGYTIDEVRQLNVGSSNALSNLEILRLIEPIFEAYNSCLKENNEIDFNDMIHLAKQYVLDGKYQNPYKYVIVDEYQDISKARYMLLKVLRESQDYDLFCVGDDWQSVYRFASSDIGYILNFERYWGSTEMSKIETTYRFSRDLIEISGNFVMRNPAQIKKSIKGKSQSREFVLGEISGYTDKFAIEFMITRLQELPKNSSVFFIGRYTFDGKLLNDNNSFECKYNTTTGLIDVFMRSRPDLKMNFITAHKSKGLQADYVFIINNKKSRMGFPSKMQNAAILELLLDNSDSYPYAEERRLFYVAMTRAKQKVFLVTVSEQESEFVDELKSQYGDKMKKDAFTCPLCGGHLIKRSGSYGEFLGCSNYKSHGCRFTRNLKS